jgi:hypothetical protein
LNVSGAPVDSPVPDALGRVLQEIRNRVGGDMVDRVWIFPPLIRGRKEWGLVAVSSLTQDPDRRTLYTARYSAELTGTGSSLDCGITVEGDAPPDRLPRVMDGVVRRSDLQLGEAREVKIRGESDKLSALVTEYGGVDVPLPPEGEP